MTGVGEVIVVPAVVVLASVLVGCQPAEDIPRERPAPGCEVLASQDVARTLGVERVRGQDASTPLKGRTPILGCQWEALTGAALTVTFASRQEAESPDASVANWKQACATPSDVSLDGASGASCADDAFGATGTELLAVYDKGSMTMRLGLRREKSADADDGRRLTEVARRLIASVPKDRYDTLIERL